VLSSSRAGSIAHHIIAQKAWERQQGAEAAKGLSSGAALEKMRREFRLVVYCPVPMRGADSPARGCLARWRRRRRASEKRPCLPGSGRALGNAYASAMESVEKGGTRQAPELVASAFTAASAPLAGDPSRCRRISNPADHGGITNPASARHYPSGRFCVRSFHTLPWQLDIDPAREYTLYSKR